MKTARGGNRRLTIRLRVSGIGSKGLPGEVDVRVRGSLPRFDHAGKAVEKYHSTWPTVKDDTYGGRLFDIETYLIYNSLFNKLQRTVKNSKAWRRRCAHPLTSPGLQEPFSVS